MKKIIHYSGKVYCGIDFHKHTSTFHACGEKGEVIENTTTIRTSGLVSFFSNRKEYHIGIEASGGVHHVVQQLKAQGHKVTIINPNKFRVGVGGKKTDEKDAEAIAHALRLNYIPEVYHKSENARQLKTLLNNRELCVRTRVNFINHIRGTLREYGLTIPQGVEAFWANVSENVHRVENGFIRKMLEELVQKVRELETTEAECERVIQEMMKEDNRVKQLETIPGIGFLTASAFLAVIDDIERFKSAGEFASYLGLTPSEHSSGGKHRMGSITRSGSEMLRRYLIHGARACLRFGETSKDNTTQWGMRLKNKVGFNKATVALAHKHARIAYAIMRDKTSYGIKVKEAA